VQFLANGTSLGVVSNYPFGAFPLQPLVIRESAWFGRAGAAAVTGQPIQFVWTNVPRGAYSLTAVAIDNAGLQTTSDAMDIQVTTNLPVPHVRIITPVNGAEFPDLAPINLYAAAGETNGVGGYGGILRQRRQAWARATNYLAAEPGYQAPFRLHWLPFYLPWTNAPVGSNLLTAVATGQ